MADISFVRFNKNGALSVKDEMEWLYLRDISVFLQVKVLFAGQDIDRSPFLVNVSKALGDPHKVQARGPGLEPVGNVANKPTYFDIYTAGNDREMMLLAVCSETRD